MTARHVIEYDHGKHATCDCGKRLHAKTWAKLERCVVDHIVANRPGHRGKTEHPTPMLCAVD